MTTPAQMLPSFNTRIELASLALGTGAELGVAGGHYSDTLCRFGKPTRHWAIDRWTDHHDLREYKHALERLAQFPAARVLRATFDEAVELFADGSLDYLYIDGYAHTGQDGGNTLRRWWPKLKPGGLFAGHDYHPRWRPTMIEVDAFAAQHDLRIQTTRNDDFPSWYCRKPA